MLTLPTFFAQFLSNIEPPKERADAAKDLPAQIRDFLQEAELVTTVDPHSRLAGSYARHTAVGRIKDVDILLVVDPAYGDKEPGVVLEDLANALEGLPESLGDLGEVKLREQRRSVNVNLLEAEFQLDIVPVVIPGGTSNPLLVPDREWSKWIKSHPLGYADFLSELNADNEQKVVPLIKMMKHWRDVHMVYRRPKSYWLECLTVRHIDKGWVTTSGKSMAEVFADILDSIYSRFEEHFDGATVPKIPDPILGNNVAFNWKRTHFETFMRRLDESRKWARNALADGTSREDAVELWRKVLGEEFPEEVDEAAVRIATDIEAKGAWVAPSGRILFAPASVAVQAPKHRFYGK